MPDNVLNKIPYELLGSAMQTLPPVETTAVDTVEAAIHVPHVGPVRITYRKFRAEHDGKQLLFWIANRAQRVDRTDEPEHAQ